MKRMSVDEKVGVDHILIAIVLLVALWWLKW